MTTKFIAGDSHDIHHAIHLSVSYGQIVTVTLASGVDFDTALTWVSQRSESYDYSDRNSDEETGALIWDVWGDDGKGGEFRLFLMEAAS
jgi:hypothetical protein